MSSETPYDVMPYLSRPFAFTHPDRLRAVAALFGVEAVPADKCSVLEIGCSSGMNICAMAATLPGSTFVGIDLSETQLAEGRAIAEELKLKNISLKLLDLKDAGEQLGKFDYIICHGLFSWVEPETQRRILKLCRGSLSESGVAYISYNTLPGWYPRLMLRDMLMYHAGQFKEPQMFVRQARAMTGLLSKALQSNDAPLSLYLKNTLQQIRSQPDWYLRHDVLEEINEPLYFHQFAALCIEEGLQYVSDAELPKMVDLGFSEEVRESLRSFAGDQIRFEQYLDFLWNRSFRRSIVCHKERVLDRHDAPARVQVCRIATPLKRDQKVRQDDIVRFVNPEGGFIETNDPLAVHVLDQLSELYPQSKDFDSLFAAAEAALGASIGLTDATRAEERAQLAESLWNLAARDYLELSMRPWPLTQDVSEVPEAFRLARIQARDSTEVTSLRHEVIELDELARRMLPLLDGKTGIEDIFLQLQPESPEEGAESQITREAVAETMVKLAYQGLLSR